jgi:3-phenylpropionate/trans-cinnamate dioxygenase ferredoxin reductase subunit
MPSDRAMVIVGAGVAGVHAAETLRTEGYEGRIILVDRDTEMPYDRPPLSKEYLGGDATETDIALRDPARYEELGIQLRLGMDIVELDVDKRELVAADGTRLPWERLLLATGSRLRQLNVEGADLGGIYYLKTLADAKRIRESLRDVRRLVVIGAGFIGAEVAVTCRKLGIEVTVIELMKYPLAHILGDEMGQYFLHLHRSNGVDMITEDSVVAFRGHVNVQEVVTAKGRHISCQAVVVGVGVAPNTMLSHEKLLVNRGYVVDEYGETSIPGIFAAGDCTMWPYKSTHIHVEHWDHAVNHGKVVAKNMLRPRSEPYRVIPYFWSDQYNHRFQYLGHASSFATTVLRGNVEDQKFTLFYLDDEGVVNAALVVNRPKDVLPIRRLIAQQQPVDMTVLADPDFALAKAIAN